MTASIRHDTVVLGVPAYNEARFIERTLRSIQAQTHADFAVVITDNASIDATSDLCADFARADPRFTHVRQSANIGAAANFDFAREASESPFFGWVGAHDLLHPEFLARHLAALRANPWAAGSFTYFEWIDADDRPLQRDGDVGIAAPRHGAWLRYLWSVAIGADLGPMHSVFRRDGMSPLRFRNAPAADHIFLSDTVFCAPFLALPGHLYLLRHFDEALRTEDTMQRITGKAGVKVDMQVAIEAYLADFELMHPPGTPGHRMRPLVSWLLHDRLDAKSLRLTKRLRSVVKRMHDARAWLRPRPTDQR